MNTAHFKLEEFLCPHCGQGATIVKPELLEACERVREIYGKIMPVNSGYRCPAHNLAIGGAKDSAHMEGMAADIFDPKGELAALLTEEMCEQLAIWLEDPKATKGWVHITIRPAVSRHFKP